MLSQLAGFLKEKYRSSVWPGTRVGGKTAWVLHYDFGLVCAEVLKRAAHGLYDWQHPALPEDLCLLRSTGEPWLVTIAHEGDGYLDPSRREKSRLLRVLPGFAHLVSEDLWVGDIREP